MGFSTEKLDNMEDTALSKLIRRLPHILSYSITDNMEPKLDWLQERLQLDETALSNVIFLNPSTLSCSTDVLEDKLMWIQQRLYLTDEELSKMIQQYPALLGCNIDSNLEPTLDFYIDALGDENQALALVTRNPSSFAYSLENRLKPRLKQAFDTGMVVDSKLLRLMMVYTNDKWNRKVTKRIGKIK